MAAVFMMWIWCLVVLTGCFRIQAGPKTKHHIHIINTAAMAKVNQEAQGEILIPEGIVKATRPIRI